MYDVFTLFLMSDFDCRCLQATDCRNCNKKWALAPWFDLRLKPRVRGMHSVIRHLKVTAIRKSKKRSTPSELGAILFILYPQFHWGLLRFNSFGVVLCNYASPQAGGLRYFTSECLEITIAIINNNYYVTHNALIKYFC